MYTFWWRNSGRCFALPHFNMRLFTPSDDVIERLHALYVAVQDGGVCEVVGVIELFTSTVVVVPRSGVQAANAVVEEPL